MERKQERRDRRIFRAYISGERKYTMNYALMMEHPSQPARAMSSRSRQAPAQRTIQLVIWGISLRGVASTAVLAQLQQTQRVRPSSAEFGRVRPSPAEFGRSNSGVPPSSSFYDFANSYELASSVGSPVRPRFVLCKHTRAQRIMKQLLAQALSVITNKNINHQLSTNITTNKKTF